ncbi:MAG: histidine phosphatase family protein [Bacteroidales bacterium]|nr:histidine phosphatase family protein [Bacteroidales bacterium]
MKTLYIVRHAKSSWDHPELPDEARPLLEKGKKRTKLLIDFLLKNEVQVDMIMSSHAVRALETAKILAYALRYPEDKVQVSKSLYFTDEEGLFNVFFDLSNDITSLMIVGHNPTLTNFINRFMEHKIEWLPTSGVACFTFNIGSWAELSGSKGKLKFMVTPKTMKDKSKRRADADE